MGETIKYRLSVKQDINDIKNMLLNAELPVSDIDEGKIDFIVAVNDKKALVGCIGLERYGKDGLLRSLAVEKAWRNKRIGHELLYRLLSLSREYGVNDLHLLTTTAEKFFALAGFSISPRSEAPSSVSSTAEFSSLCPSGSTYMLLQNIRQLESAYWRDIRVFQKDKETGSAYWAIKGENLLFTYFEVPPDTVFTGHEHTSEQITYVLEGALFFEIENKIYQLTDGDTIIIPPNKMHKVWTGTKLTKAIDAWSPANEKYIPGDKPKQDHQTIKLKV